MSRTVDDLLGVEFGLYEVIGPHERRLSPSGKPETWWRCRCSCGNERWLRAQLLVRKNGKGHCGCIKGQAGYFVSTEPVQGRRIPRDVVEEVVRWREQGEKLAVIALTFKLKYDTVASILSRRKVGPLVEPDHRMSAHARRAWA